MANSQITSTVSSVLQTVADLRGESTVNTDAIRIRAVSNAEQTFAKRRFWSCHLLKDQTTTGSGVNPYTIGSATNPMRLKGLVEVFVGDTLEASRYLLCPFAEYKERYNADNTSQLVYEYYDQANDAWKMYINPAPAATGTIYYSYYYMPPTRTLSTDTIICPNMDLIVSGGLAYLYEGEEETNKAIEQKQLFEQILLELEELENTPNKNQRYAMKTDYNTLGTYGLGSY